ERAGPMAGLALDVPQGFVVGHRRASRLAVAGDVAAHAFEVVFLEAVDERLIGPRVGGRVPDLALLEVAGGTLLDADVARLALRDGGGLQGGEGLLVVLVDPLVIAAHPIGDGGVDPQALADLFDAIAEVAPGGRRRFDLEIAALLT